MEQNEIYDEEYDESYDDEILSESEKEYEQTKNTSESKQDNLYILVFKNYLEKECGRDEFFKAKYKAEYLHNCYDYVKNQARKLAVQNMAMIQSGKVFRMAMDYFNDEVWKAEAEKKAKAEEQKKIIAEKQKAVEVKKQEEDEWTVLRKKFYESPSSMTKEEKEKFDKEKYKHLEQQSLFDL